MELKSESKLIKRGGKLPLVGGAAGAEDSGSIRMGAERRAVRPQH